MSTIVMMVDLDCDKCYKKIRKVICKLQDKVNIKAISYDEKNNTVTVAGPFDAEEVSDRLCSGAGKVITDIHVVGGNAHKPGAKAHNKPEKIKDGGGGKPDKIKNANFPPFDKKNVNIPPFDKKNVNFPPFDKKNVNFDFDDGGRKPEKKHVKFDFDDGGHDHGHGHAHHDGRKPRVVTTTAPAVSRLEAPRLAPSMPMSAMAPRPMPMSMPMPMPMPTQSMMPVQATSTPSIWPPPPPSAAPEWGYSGALAYGGWGPQAGGYYYGGPVHSHGGYGPPPPQYGYSTNAYQQPPYYDEEPSAACSVM